MKHPRVRTGTIRYIINEYHSFVYFHTRKHGVERTDVVEVNWTRNRWVWWD